MTYETFKTTLIDQLKVVLPETVSIQIQPVLKNNNLRLDGLLLCDENINISPTIYLNYFYDLYQNGEDLSSICDRIVASYQNLHLTEDFDLSFLENYDTVKDHIIYKLINAEQNKDLLLDVPHIPYMDLAIVFCCILAPEECDFLSESSTGSILIHNNHLDLWHITMEDLYQDAKANTPLMLKPRIRPLYDTIRDITGEAPIPMDADPDDIPIFILSNTRGYLGAAVILYQNLLEQCGEQFDEDFYVIPSSIHEVLLLPKDASTPHEFLDSMVEDVNTNHVDIEEVLSNHVYWYSRAQKQLVY